MRRIAALTPFALAAVVLAPSGRPVATAGPAAAPPPAAVAYRAPVEPVRVLRGFEPPASPYGPGHRGVDLAASPGQLVRAAGIGVVSFAGRVAGRGLVVLAHPDGVRTEYEPLAASVSTGETVSAGEVIGRIAGTHDGCAPGRCLHWGARRDGSYFDPLNLLRPLGVVRLLPWAADGRRAGG